MSNPIAIVGASARAAAASAVRAGYQPVTADLFADEDLRQFATTTRISPYPNALLDWLRATEPPAWMYTGALENHPELVDQMAWVAPLWGNPGDVLQRVRSPWELSAVLRAAGLPFPETRATSEGLPENASWLAKTYRGASGSGVWEYGETRGQGDKKRIAEVARAEGSCPPLDLSPGPVFQRRVAGAPSAAVFVAAGGEAQVLGVTRQLVGEAWLGAHGFQYAGSIGPWPVPSAVSQTIQEIGRVLAEQLELTGLFGVDMIVDGEQVWTVEVNPRYTASVEIVERATGVHAVAAHAAACRGLPIADCELRIEPPTRQSAGPIPNIVHGKAILFAKRDVVIAAEFAAMALAKALTVPWPALADVPSAGRLVECGRPILTVFAAGPTTGEVERQLQQRVAALEQQLYARIT